MIADAVDMVQHNKAKRIDGTCWRVYTAGAMIRIDITPPRQLAFENPSTIPHKERT